MGKKKDELFEVDRKVELRMRLAMKRAEEQRANGHSNLEVMPPSKEQVDKVIDRVQQL